LLEQVKHFSRTYISSVKDCFSRHGKKEFDINSKIGFGIKGNLAVRDLDFEHVRGNFDYNKFTIQLINEIETTESEANRLTDLLCKKFVYPRFCHLNIKVKH